MLQTQGRGGSKNYKWMRIMREKGRRVIRAWVVCLGQWVRQHFRTVRARVRTQQVAGGLSNMLYLFLFLLPFFAFSL